MKLPLYNIRAKVWLYKGEGPWHFVTIEKNIAKEIKKEYALPRRGFGSIPVKVTVGSSSWKTSIFPDKTGVYLLPLKKEVRRMENIKIGYSINLSLEIFV